MGGANSSSMSSAAPASGKYGGFGSKDMEQMGYNNPTYTSSSYDPYTNKSSTAVPTKKEEVHSKPSPDKPKKKKKKVESSDSSASSSSDSSSEEEKEVKKKKKKTGLGPPKQAERSITGAL